MLRAALADSALDLSAAEKRQVEEYLEHNEFEEAFSLLVAMIEQDEKRIDASLFDAIDAIGKTMALSTREWEGLRKLLLA
jgi:hypothetical protein